MKKNLKTIYELGKVRISLPVALSALTGYVIFKGALDHAGWMLSLGVFFMSCSSSVLNHLQEKDIDAKMPRTQNRPLPSKRISPLAALLIAITLAFMGSAVLYFSGFLVALLLSWVTLFFYNVVYTPLKRITAFAVIPGSMVGALPPLIGWSAAGGRLDSEIILLVAAFFFLGQIPHFWLLLLMFGDQYKLAGLPSLNQIFSDNQIKRITFTWVITTVASAFLVIFFVISNSLIMFFLLFYIFYLLSSLSIGIFIRDNFKVKSSFYKLNFLYLFMMIFLIIDGLLRDSHVQI